MFKLILVTVLLGLAAADHIDKNAEIVVLSNDPADADGNYAVKYETTNGIAAQESGNVAGVSGAFQYVSPDGTPILVTYSADQDGFHPSGAHLPTPPPIPEAIARSIEYIRTHPSSENVNLRRS